MSDGQRRAVKERPILFSAPMVRAIRSGAKKQTRRVVTGYRIEGPRQHGIFDWYDGSDKWTAGHGGTDWTRGGPLAFSRTSAAALCPYGVPGDRLWVRETWAVGKVFDRTRPAEIPAPTTWYAADGVAEESWLLRGRWRPSIHMPRWASRITLEVTEVRVQRLQEISEDDAKAEGVTPDQHDAWFQGLRHVSAFGTLWDRINGKRAPWASNPWVWCVSFRKVD